MQLVQKLAFATTGVAMSFVVVQAKPAQAASLNLGPALTATGVDTVRNLFGVDGTGITIGVISDSFNTSTTFDRFGNLDTYATDIANGYLPAGIQVLQDNNGPKANDEGRAMMQIIHAIAPGASLAFYPATTPAAANDLESQEIFANGIQALKAAGANIIVDDIVFLEVDDSGLQPTEPNPPDGPINQAIESVFNQGVSYFSIANNYKRLNSPIFGHPNNPDALTVGAVYYGISPLSILDKVTQQGQLEPFSAAGVPPFMKPDVVAPDGLEISFNLAKVSPLDPNTGFYNFFGTSAATPYAAAVAALLLQADPNASPSQIYSALRDTAKPLGTPGFNFESGYGLIQADKAIAALGVKPKPVPEPSSVPILLGVGILGTGMLLERHQQQKVLLKAEDAFRGAVLKTKTQTSGQQA